MQPGGTPTSVRAEEVIRACLQEGRVEFEWLHQRPLTGELWWGQVSLRRIEIESKTCLIGRVRDINETKKFQDRLTELAYVDGLTRLPNRLAACEWLDHELEADSWKDLVLIAFDIDGFQQINELFGHQLGDHYLKLAHRKQPNSEENSRRHVHDLPSGQDLNVSQNMPDFKDRYNYGTSLDSKLFDRAYEKQIGRAHV